MSPSASQPQFVCPQPQLSRREKVDVYTTNRNCVCMNRPSADLLKNSVVVEKLFRVLYLVSGFPRFVYDCSFPRFKQNERRQKDTNIAASGRHGELPREQQAGRCRGPHASTAACRNGRSSRRSEVPSWLGPRELRESGVK